MIELALSNHRRKRFDIIYDDFHNLEVKAGNSDSVAVNNIQVAANK